uniref:Uncharacterized protein MANES_11G072300 n=1 Tax=Rhizophora mucronata TaxID=61149 RepID=A0A2P2PYB2_RHIMU
MSQIVQVVSMLEVPMRLGSASFQSNEVMGPQQSLFLFPLRMLLRSTRDWSSEMRQTRRKSLEVARRSGFWHSLSGMKMVLVGG